MGYRLLRAVRPFLPSRILLSLPDLRRTDVLNVIARYIKAKSYLEIGVSSGENFLRVNVSTKCGVDPIGTGAGGKGGSINYSTILSDYERGIL